MPIHVTLSIPVAEIAHELEGKQQVLLLLVNYTDRYLEPSQLKVALDGVVGTHRPTGDRIATSVSWDPFPSSPDLLEIRYDEGAQAVADVDVLLHDFECERTAPPQNCGK